MYRSYSLLAAILFAINSWAQVPRVFNYDGFLSDPNGDPLSGTFTAEFAIFDAENNGDRLWREKREIKVEDGNFSVAIGTTEELTADLFKNSSQLYLDVTINNESLRPRITLGSTPYALLCEQVVGNAELNVVSVNGKTVINNEGEWVGGVNTIAKQLRHTGIGGSGIGPKGDPGLPGAPGAPGTPGTDGSNGINCWDSNENGLCDDLNGGTGDEDSNHDNQCNVFDCVTLSAFIADLSDVGNVNTNLCADNSILIYSTTSNEWACSPIDNLVNINSANIQDNSITGADIAINTITSNNITNSTISGSDLSTSININTTGTINANAVVTTAINSPSSLNLESTDEMTLISTASMSFSVLDDGATNKISFLIDGAEQCFIDDTGNLTVTGDVIAANIAAGTTVSGTNTGDQTITLTGDISGSGTNSFSATIGSNTITSVKIADGSVTGTDIASGTIVSGNILDGAIAGADIAASTITSSNISDGTIAGADIGAATITSNHITNNTIVGNDLATDITISTSGDITTNSLTTSTIDSFAPFNIGSSDTVTISSTGDMVLSALDNGNTNKISLYVDGIEQCYIEDTGDLYVAGNIIAANMTAGSSLSGVNTGDQTITLTGDITGSGTSSFSATIGSNSITSSKIADGTVTGTDIASGTISSTNILDATISGADIATGTVSSSNISDGTISNSDIAGNAVSSSNIIDATIAGSDIAANTITSSNITNNTIIGADLAANISISTTGDMSTNSLSTSIIDSSAAMTIASADTISMESTGDMIFSALDTGTANKISFLVDGVEQAFINDAGELHVVGTMAATNISSGSSLSGTNTGDQTITLTGDIAGSGTGAFAATIGTGAINSSKIADGSVTGTDIAPSTITTTNILDATISGTDIASATISTANIIDGTITGADIGASAISSSNILDATVSGTDISNNTVTSTNILNATIASVDIANDAVTLATQTTGNYVATIASGTNISVSGSGSENAAVTVNTVNNPTFSTSVTTPLLTNAVGGGTSTINATTSAGEDTISFTFGTAGSGTQVCSISEGGNLSVSTSVTAPSITTASGNLSLSAASGTISASTNNVSLTTGNIAISSSGTITTSSGSISSTSGNIQTSTGNIKTTGGGCFGRTYVAASASATGNAGSRSAADTLCNTASANSKVCTYQEMIESGRCGVTMPVVQGWINTGATVDCNAWNTNSILIAGSSWTTGGIVVTTTCNIPQSYLCCK